MAFTFNTRYKPKTEREYTKTDLTVYDSAAGHPQEITIYGKSEVVDNDIHSVGEGWATVDLGTLSWNYLDNRFITTAGINNIKTGVRTVPIICAKYIALMNGEPYPSPTDDKIIYAANTNICIHDSDYTDAATFKTAMSGVYLTYQLADATQGNALSVKTDNGTGIDGTMATFTTGLPLYGIAGGAKDSMWCDGTDGEAVKNCAEIDLGTLNWYVASEGDNCYYTLIPNTAENMLTLTAKYTKVLYSLIGTTDKAYCRINERTFVIHDSDFTTPTECKQGLSGAMLIYELATPTTTPLTAAEIAQFNALDTYAGTTHYSANDNPEIKIKYTIKIPTI